MAPERSTDEQRPVTPRPLASIADLSELLGGDTNRSRRFLGGLMVGALVGAAVAGTAALRMRGKSGRAG